MKEAVQYIVVRKDLIKTMGIGKTAAQVAHASLGSVIEKTKIGHIQINDEINIPYANANNKTTIIDTPATEAWFKYRFTKIVVSIKTKQKLLNLSKKLDKDGIRYKLIMDACNTKLEPEEEDGTTLTCMGVIPIFRDEVPKYLKSLQLLE